jgi:membrane-associated phospholipid phosphatase
MHVAFSIGIASMWLKEKSAGVLWKTAVVVIAAMICLSTVFLKQHSVVDFFAALPLCLLAEWIACGKNYWLPRLRGQALQK